MRIIIALFTLALLAGCGEEASAPSSEAINYSVICKGMTDEASCKADIHCEWVVKKDGTMKCKDKAAE